MKRSLVVAIRELGNFLRDRADLAFSLLLPVATFALIYGAFGGDDLFRGTAHIVNEDPGGAYSEQLLSELRKEPNLNMGLHTRAEADRKLARSDLDFAVVIPAGFSARLEAGQPAELIFLQRGNGGWEGQVVASIVRGAVSDINRGFQAELQISAALAGKGVPAGAIAVTTQRFLERERARPLVGVTEVPLGRRPDTVTFYLPGIVTMYVLFAISLGAAAIVEERRRGTLERLLTTRLTVGELFFGKFLSGVFRGFVQTLVLLTLSYIVFRIFTPLSFVESVAVALVFAAAGSAIGLVIASVARTQDAATWIGVFVTMGMTMLGGTFFTIEPDSPLAVLGNLSLNKYANHAFRTLMAEGGPIMDLRMDFTVMAGVVIAGLVLSRLLFKALPQVR